MAAGPAPVVHHTRTADGWRIALSRYRSAGPHRAYPVLLVPGLGSNRATFDLHPRVSLARRLAALGWDVWSLELRNHGRSDRVKRGMRRYGWCFDDHVRYDVPAALELVVRHTGRSAAHYIGHSMGGLLLYSYLACIGEQRIRSGITIGSSLDYSASKSDFHRLRKLKALAHRMPALPLGSLAALTAPFAARVHTRATEFNVWPTNIDPSIYRRLLVRNFHSVSAPVLTQLATAFDPGGLRPVDGGPCYQQRLRGICTPVLAVAGSRDRQCPPAAARRTVRTLGPHGQLAVFGRDHGHADEYGHFDLIIGRRAPVEVWPVLEQWLQSHEPRSTSAQSPPRRDEVR